MASIRPRQWKTPSGEDRLGYEVSWYEGGRQRKKLFSGIGARKAAERHRTKVDVALQNGKASSAFSDKPVAALTVQAAGERWVGYVQRTLRRERTTWEHYEQQLRDHICPVEIERKGGSSARFGNLRVDEVTAPDCEAFKDVLLAKLSVKTARKIMTVARMLFNDVVRRGEISQNPAEKTRVHNVERGEDEVQIPQAADLAAIIEAVRTEEPAAPTFAQVWIMSTIFSGLRPSENRGAAIEDLILDGDRPGIQVRRRADLWGRIGRVKTKSGRRFVPLPPSVVALLRRWLLVAPRGSGFADPEDPRRRLHLLFPTSIGTVQSLANIYNRVWLPVMIKAGLVDWVPKLDANRRPTVNREGEQVLRPIARYNLNSLRHLCASLKIAEGMNPKTLMHQMGHSSIQVTYDIYGRLIERYQSNGDALARIERNLLG